ncbi:M81 family metallopeptidase [Algimonas porphyrae]|uniref:Microcystinase C n=1 Tax=Algimonas porphyrae TaxID=1128113 RepID=A0ABQ5V2J1_9PROT|nr:M81 family metallopeptidase [Algimonas porphyrae]GLQ21297.1 microcystinase C [Algimonas porphyrae]
MTLRIAIAGILLEANRFAPVTARADFDAYLMQRGESLGAFAQLMGLASAANDELDIEFVPILVAGAESGGPLDHADYLELVAEIETGLRDNGPLDGVFLFAHGAGLTTELDDLDGDYFGRVRAVVGPDVPIVAELDLHANLSDAMVEHADLLVGYRTNPHVDVADRAKECIVSLCRLIAGERIEVAYQRLPLITSQIAQLTGPGTPYQAVIDHGEALRAKRAALANVTLLSGFSFADTAYNGFAVYVAAWGDSDLAISTCDALARDLWVRRSDFAVDPMTVEDAVRHEKSAQAGNLPGPRIYADVADNPGGGGRGNTIHLLKGFLDAGLPGVIAGVYYDPALVADANRQGEGAHFQARFNSAEPSPLSGTLDCPAIVERLFIGDFINGPGVQAGERVKLGECCLLSLGEGHVKVVVVSYRNQVFNPGFFTCAGLDPTRAKAIIVKSRGHFRAGFAELAGPEEIFEVDAPGLCTADIASVEWSNLPSPTYPMDIDTSWSSNVILKPSPSGSNLAGDAA